jgi:hypothetical protein
MTPIELEEAKLTDLDVVANSSDLRYDLHAFAEYVRAHEIKRAHRTNQIPRAHEERVAKCMADPVMASKTGKSEESPWIAHLDRLSLTLNFISYDTKGSYAGYSSSEASFPDNYIKFNQAEYERFLHLPIPAQEGAILNAHLKNYGDSNNEFFHPAVLGRLDRFHCTGCATGVVPLIPFDKARRRLLELLAQCPSGAWFTTASLVARLRECDPWFLIPKSLPASALKVWNYTGRYLNFDEHKRGDWGGGDRISEKDPEGFAKVEGRFVERFLEGLPLVLGYTEVAYTRGKTEFPIEPSRGLLPAFRVTERLVRALRNEIAPPKVTVLPNFEVHVESLFYPAETERELALLGEQVQRGIVSVFKLTRPRVAAALAADAESDALGTLKALSGRDLPGNVEQELREWAGHSEKFILFEGYGLLEGAREEAGGVAPFVAEAISPDFALVRSPEAIYRHLESAEQAPLRIQHAENALAAPPGARSRLAPAAPPTRAPARKLLKLKRSVQTTLWFADAEAHAAFCKLLLDAKCVVPTDRRALTVSFARKAEPVVKECLKQFSQEYAVRIEDIET